jgi:hypothetical protein
MPITNLEGLAIKPTVWLPICLSDFMATRRKSGEALTSVMALEANALEVQMIVEQAHTANMIGMRTLIRKIMATSHEQELPEESQAWRDTITKRVAKSTNSVNTMNYG